VLKGRQNRPHQAQKKPPLVISASVEHRRFFRMDLGILAHAGWFMILRSSLLPVSVVSYQRRDLFSRILRNLSLPDN
jgi:hypothetical protein